MILAEKIIKLRKQNGWSQEELAAKLEVSRQSVSKWESAASVPELDKIIRLSEIFGVSTDYLLKDETQDRAEAGDRGEEYERRDAGARREDYERHDAGARRDAGDGRQPHEESDVINVADDEVRRYIDLMEGAAKRIAAGVFACIFSPVCLIVLGGLAEYKDIGITENMAGGLGVVILLLIIAAAVGMFIMTGIEMNKFQYLEKEPICISSTAAMMVRERKAEYEPIYKRDIALGVILCILSIIPLMIAAAFDSSDLTYIYCVGALLILVACGVFRLVHSGMIYGSYQKLMEEGEYTRGLKRENKRNDRRSTIYWCTVTAIYLAVSFLTGHWEKTWIIWPCAGVFFAAVCGIAAAVRKKNA